SSPALSDRILGEPDHPLMEIERRVDVAEPHLEVKCARIVVRDVEVKPFQDRRTPPRKSGRSRLARPSSNQATPAKGR
ncbi:MAG: hypothetical protein K2P79_01680, partial [Sphingomonas sp.]|nr:hypothetical protein [Sphingomonas sp.]